MEKSLSEAWKMLSQWVFEEMEGWRTAHGMRNEIEEIISRRGKNDAHLILSHSQGKQRPHALPHPEEETQQYRDIGGYRPRCVSAGAGSEAVRTFRHVD